MRINDIEMFKEAKLASLFKHIPSDRVFRLRKDPTGAMFLWHKHTETRCYDVEPGEWQQIIEELLDPQQGLIRLLECIHDGDRVEILHALDELHTHIRFMGDLPLVQKDTDENTYIVPNDIPFIPDTTISDTPIEVDDIS